MSKFFLFIFHFFLFILWLASLVMAFVSFHWGWVVTFIVISIYYSIRFGIESGIGFIDIDF